MAISADTLPREKSEPLIHADCFCKGDMLCVREVAPPAPSLIVLLRSNVTNGPANRSAASPIKPLRPLKNFFWASFRSLQERDRRVFFDLGLRSPIAQHSRQRLRCAQPLARRRMAAQRFCRLLTLSDLISAISEPVLRSVFVFALAPLRGSWRQQPRGAAVSAAMVAPCADEVLRAAVVMRQRVFMR
jgi:hypothetical protein